MKTKELLEGIQARTQPGKTMKWQDRFFVVDDGWTKAELIGEMHWILYADEKYNDMITKFDTATIPDKLMHSFVREHTSIMQDALEGGYEAYEEAKYILMQETSKQLGFPRSDQYED